MYKVDLNCDLGESFGNYKIGCDGEVIKYISSCNVACGFHASDPVVMNDTIKYAKENNVLCCAIELFVVIFHIEARCKRLLHFLNESTDVLLVQKTRAENNVNA